MKDEGEERTKVQRFSKVQSNDLCSTIESEGPKESHERYFARLESVAIASSFQT